MSETSNNEKKKERGVLRFFALVFLFLFVFCLVKCNDYQKTVNPHSNTGNSDGNYKIFSRSANINDLTIESDLDLLSLGLKYTIVPKVDIENLELTIYLEDKNNQTLKTINKSLGDVKEDEIIDFSLSISDYGLSVSLKAQYQSISVSGGTVKYLSD